MTLSWMLLPWLRWQVVGGVERVVELWGRRPGMHPMRKWLFGRQPVAQTENLD